MENERTLEENLKDWNESSKELGDYWAKWFEELDKEEEVITYDI